MHSDLSEVQKREEEIANNSARYEQGEVADQQYNLRKSVRQTLEEYVRGSGFLKEIESCREELEKDDVLNDVQALTKTILEVELRDVMRASENFPTEFLAQIMDGDPRTIEALMNAPVPFNIEEGILEDGKTRRREVLKPVVAKRFHLLQDAQATIEGFVNAIMPVQSGDIDPLADLATG